MGGLVNGGAYSGEGGGGGELISGIIIKKKKTFETEHSIVDGNTFFIYSFLIKFSSLIINRMHFNFRIKTRHANVTRTQQTGGSEFVFAVIIKKINV